MKKILLICSALLFALQINATITFTSSSVALESSDDYTIAIYEFSGEVGDTELTIADSYIYGTDFVRSNVTGSSWEESDYKVVTLGDGNYNIYTQASIATSVTIGQYVTTIKANAFSGFSSLQTFTVNATTPPTLESGAFSSIPESATLVVPTGCVSAYTSSDWANYFSTITDGSESGVGTAIGSVMSAQKGYRVQGLSLVFAEETEVEVYNIAGSRVFKGTATTVSLPQKGIYIVKTAEGTSKAKL